MQKTQQKRKSFAIHYLCLFIIVLACDAIIQAITKGVRHSSLSSHFAFSAGSALVIFAIAMPVSLLFGKNRFAVCVSIALALLLGLGFAADDRA
jgi:hypothetical protein